MCPLKENLRNREWLFKRLKAEVIGPDQIGDASATRIESGMEVMFESWEAWRKPKIQPDGEEILWQDPPVKRYGAGVLFPAGVTDQRHLAEDADSTPVEGPEEGPDSDARVDEDLENRLFRRSGKPSVLDDSDSHEVTLANAYRPSALGLSFLADLSAEHEGMIVRVEFATYARQQASISPRDDGSDPISRDLWLRVPGRDEDGTWPSLLIPAQDLLQEAKIERSIPGHESRDLRVVIVSRAQKEPHQRLVTVCLVNRGQKDAGRLDERCFFQCGFTVEGASRHKWILPYPESKAISEDPMDEENVTRLLYRDRQTFAIGHGCAAEWDLSRSVNGLKSRVARVWTSCLPSFETPTTSAEVNDQVGTNLRVSMHKLAGLDPTDDGFSELVRLLEAYEEWLRTLDDLEEPRSTVPGVIRPPIPEELRDTARGLISECSECLRRMWTGLEFLKGDSPESRKALRAFRLMNEVMLIGQLRSSRETRTPSWDEDSGRFLWDRQIANPDHITPQGNRGFWRPFQIAFVLMSIPAICDPAHQERRKVDLIWFPTGGGKTEAYLGLTAFTLLFNRLTGKRAGGVDVLMRYTLRLLTAQQFQRAGLLFCALEWLRMDRRVPELGEDEFRIGMWVGGQATPNSRANARRALRRLQEDPQYAENPFVLLKCPWCNAKFGPVSDTASARGSRGRRGGFRPPKSVFGYSNEFVTGRRTETVVFRCDDPRCFFGNRILPIVVIDEDVYDRPPDLVIGTVDKFAMLAWKPEIRRLFGIAENGERVGAPPSLIIQDELHLISGPLGSMVGAYETAIDELCSDRRPGREELTPKIVASTATISRAPDQARSLYARTDVSLFPPSGLEAGDSFFAREARNSDGDLAPGRMYVGLMAPAHGSQQTTQARVFAALLQYPVIMPVGPDEAAERDPWWTLLSFFNSLRELGGAATLLVADARDYLKVIIDRHGMSYDKIRQLINVEELTSRIRGDQIPLAIQKLEAPFRRDERGYVRDTVEACLASNIIEVGVDIDRLSLMTIVGQPKTTSQYIQVSSRVGRRPDAPGLVVVTYSQSKPRDRSHYERFRTFHDRLYAQVEPTSVTPFSPPAVDRALHGVVVSAIRQLGPPAVAESPRPCPVIPGSQLRDRIEKMIMERVSITDPFEAAAVQAQLKRRFKEWQAWDPRDYGGFGSSPPDPPLMHPAGSSEPEAWSGHSWATLTSLRDVDASCEAEITRHYLDVELLEDEQ